jgi:hypothetical protein
MTLPQTLFTWRISLLFPALLSAKSVIRLSSAFFLSGRNCWYPPKKAGHSVRQWSHDGRISKKEFFFSNFYFRSVVLPGHTDETTPQIGIDFPKFVWSEQKSSKSARTKLIFTVHAYTQFQGYNGGALAIFKAFNAQQPRYLGAFGQSP